MKNILNLSDTLALIIEHIIATTPIFSAIDMKRCAVLISTNRRKSRGAIFGKVVPLKFENGTNTIAYRGTIYRMPEVTANGSTLLYLIYFYMPRFFDLSADEKLNVIFHELYHISPAFNGDIRRMGKGKAAHGHSREHFNNLYAADLARYREIVEATPFYAFLQLDAKKLYKQFRITGKRMTMPKPVKLTTAESVIT